MDPLALVSPIGQETVESPDFNGNLAVVLVRVPVSRAGDVNRNDTYRRELAALIEAQLQGILGNG